MKVSEPISSYQANDRSVYKWVEVIVDSPYVKTPYTYKFDSSSIDINTGDILSVPFGKFNNKIGGIAIQVLSTAPENYPLDSIKEIDHVIAPNLFPPHYWSLLSRTAQYYCTDLINVVKAALPPKLLGSSQKRAKLLEDKLPEDWENLCSPRQLKIIKLLQQGKTKDYAYRHILGKVPRSYGEINRLAKRGWVETYSVTPRKATPKFTKVVTLINSTSEKSLSEQQKSILTVLKNKGGELTRQELKELCGLSSYSSIDTLGRNGYVVIQKRETLRLFRDSQPAMENHKKLTIAQSNALEIINNLDSFATALLHGVTGSGKTEVYLQAIAPLLGVGKSALVLVPEIGLTPQLTDRFRARFGNKVWVYHSGLNDGERYDTWRSLINQEACVVIGTRSAIFAPLTNLGLIILDEEHDSSYKQDQIAPTYHGCTVAKWRAELADCPLILGSATPSVTTWVEIQDKEEALYLSLPNRVTNRPLPSVEIVDLRRELHQGNRSIFSRSLQQALERMQQRGEQGILFIPRRGHSTFVSCRSCGYVIECPHCDVSLSYHHTHQGATELLRCHYCNHTQVQAKNCPECGSPYFKHFGTGTQKVAQELSKSFPKLSFIRFDSDTTRTKGAHRILLTRFAQGEADLLIGTQMLTKGLDLAQVTLVGVVAADGLLHQEDYYASERAFQSLTQVAGRAGRGQEAGRVIIQTYSPNHPVIEAVKNHDYHSFMEDALAQRQDCGYPPYGRLILLKIKGLVDSQVMQTAEVIANSCTELADSSYEVLGPAPARIMRVARRHHWQILLKFLPEAEVNVTKLSKLRNLCPKGVSLTINVDPLSME